MEGMIHKAYKVMLHTVNPKFINDESIPLRILRNAKGIAFITRIRAGFIFAGEIGGGVIFARTEDGRWSGPSSVGVAGMAWGALVGAESTDSVIILNTNEAVRVFSGKGQVKLGADIGIAIGPVGREAEAAANAGTKGLAACYSYSHSRGLFAGLSLSGVMIGARSKENARFYGRRVSVTDILKGGVDVPENADLTRLYQLLATVDHSETDRHALMVDGMTTFTDSGMPSYQGTALSSGGSIDSEGSYNYASNNQSGDSYNHGSSRSNNGSSERDRRGSFDESYISAIPIARNEHDLLPGWVTVTDEHGKPYYWNEDLNITQWERPVAVAASAPALPNSHSPSAGFEPHIPKAEEYKSDVHKAGAFTPDLSKEYSFKPNPYQAFEVSPSTETSYGVSKLEEKPLPNPFKPSVSSSLSPNPFSQSKETSPVALNPFKEPASTSTAAEIYRPARSPKKLTDSHDQMPTTTTNLASDLNSNSSSLASMAASQALLRKSNQGQEQDQPQTQSSVKQGITFSDQHVESETRKAPSIPQRPAIPKRPVSYKTNTPTAVRDPVNETRSDQHETIALSPVLVPKTLNARPRRYSLDEIKTRDFVAAEGLDRAQLEDYLLDDDFRKELKMSREEFKALPKWRQDAVKKAAGIF